MGEFVTGGLAGEIGPSECEPTHSSLEWKPCSRTLRVQTFHPKVRQPDSGKVLSVVDATDHTVEFITRYCQASHRGMERHGGRIVQAQT